MSDKKIDIVVKVDLETLRLISKLDLDAGELLSEIIKIKKKEAEDQWKKDNAESMEELNRFHEKHGPFRID